MAVSQEYADALKEIDLLRAELAAERDKREALHKRFISADAAAHYYAERADRAEAALASLVHGIRWWAAQEDGIPGELQERFVNALMLLKWPVMPDEWPEDANEWRNRAVAAEAACAAMQEWYEDCLSDFVGMTDDPGDPDRTHLWPFFEERRPFPISDAGRAYAERCDRYREALEKIERRSEEHYSAKALGNIAREALQAAAKAEEE